MNKLSNLSWEGNVRELENVIERSVVLAKGNMIDEEDLPSPETVTVEQFFGAAIQDSPTLEELEKRYIKLTLEKTGNRKDQAALVLGINRRTLYRKEREYGFVDANATDEDLDASQNSLK